MFERMAVIGCGLMGGSASLALQRAGQVRHVVGYSRSLSTSERARQLGVIHEMAETAGAAVAGADLVLVSVPVAATESTLVALRDRLEPSALLMDVGSTKGDVVQAARQALGDRISRFVPAHPIAGKEVAGVEHAEANLYQDRQVILTPLPENPEALVQRATQAWEAMGARVVSMDTAHHDAALGAVSHLPHLLAFAYMGGLLAQPSGTSFMALAGPGFRDFTRIAASDRHVWRDILLSNRAEVQHQLAAFQAALATFEAALEARDGAALERLIAEAAAARSAWPAAPAPASKA